MQWLAADTLEFPDYSETSPEGVIAIGGDLSLERLTLAYQKGIFPWYSEEDPIIWWCPDPRFVLFPKEVKVSKSMRKVLRDQKFRVTYNTAFKEVIAQCEQIERPGQEGVWLQSEMKTAYIQMHEKGMAKSVEVWNQEGKLVGGLYGVQVGNVFCGESMFAKESNASKAGFIEMVQTQEYKLVDCQIYTEHLESLGARMIPRSVFLDFLP